MRLRFIAMSFALALSSTASGQTAAPSQLDFLSGLWVILDGTATTVGSSQIVVQAPGAMIYEERRVGSDPAQPLWFENSERNQGWSQHFLGPAGRTREFTPISRPGEWPLVMGADVVLRDGTPVRFRMTMTRESDNESRRLLEMSRDRGASWNAVFDYNYRRAPSS